MVAGDLAEILSLAKTLREDLKSAPLPVRRKASTIANIAHRLLKAEEANA